jgi:uncharacterized membrane protein
VARGKRRNQQNQNQRQGQQPPRGQIVRASWEAPIPPPALLENYNNVVENGAERIMRMAEKAQDSDIEMGRAVLEVHKRGQGLGAAISILALVLASALGAFGLYLNAPTPFYLLPAALVSVPVFAVIKALVTRGDQPN